MALISGGKSLSRVCSASISLLSSDLIACCPAIISCLSVSAASNPVCKSTLTASTAELIRPSTCSSDSVSACGES